MTYLSLYAASFFLGALGAWLVSHWAPRFGLIDHPNARSSHSTPTPKGGGIGILAAFLLSSISIGISINFWLPISALALLGFLGDRIPLPYKFRLLVQFSLMIFLVLKTSPLPSFLSWHWLPVLFWVVFIVGTANFYNFMDGIDGIAGINGVIGFALLAIYLQVFRGQPWLSTLAICMSFSCLGFLPLNFPKARVFMGDIGSVSLGAIFGGLIYLSADTFLDFVCMAFFLFAIYADVLTTIFFRWKDGEKLTKAHRRHLYQIFSNEMGFPHWLVSMSFGLIQLVVGLTILMARLYNIVTLILIVVFSSVMFIVSTYYVRSSWLIKINQ